MDRQRESHRQALRQLLERSGVGGPQKRAIDLEVLVDEILRLGDGFERRNSSLDEALNSGDGTYRP